VNIFFLGKERGREGEERGNVSINNFLAFSVFSHS
jgi:hypothetical protein